MRRRRRRGTAVCLSCLLVAALGGCERDRSDPDAAAAPATPVEQAPAPVAAAPPAEAGPRTPSDEGCAALPPREELRRLLREAPARGGEAGGLFGGRKEWAAIVDREGVLCAVVASTDEPAAAWPGSQQIAKAKAYTANAFSTDDAPLSTARLYTLTQPGHSLAGLAAGNPLHPDCLAKPDDELDRRLCGGTIAFGGGVPLYKDGKRVGGLGASGDTACADHEIAKRVRDAAGLDPAGGALADDITYSGPDGASAFTHPLCANTWRNGEKLGDEAAASGY